MSHTTYTSRTGSPPSNLKPAPLRIPLRKAAASLDDNPVTVAAQHRGGHGDTPASASRRKYASHQPHPDNITRALPHRRELNSKLESLVSRFETLDAANSADTSVPQYPNKSYEPRVAGSKQNPQHMSTNYLPVKSLLNRDSSERSPRQIVPNASLRPPSSCTASTIPVLRHAKSSITSKGMTTPGGVSARRLPKSRVLRKNPPSPQQSSSVSAISSRPNTKPLRSKEAYDGQEAKEASPRPSNDLKLPAGTIIAPPKQKLSFSQAVEPSGQSANLSIQPKSSHHNIRQSQDMPLFASSTRIPELLRERSPMPPAGEAFHAKPEDKATEKLSPLGSVRDLLRDSSNIQNARQEQTMLLHESARLEPLASPANEKGTEDWGNSMDFNISMDGLGSILFSRKPGDTTLAGDEDASRRSPSRPANGSGKVSQLRKMFERSSRRFSSPRSQVPLHSRLGSEELTNDLTGNDQPSSWEESESPLSTHTIARRQSIVPSLTTEISVNDFFCDFVGDLNHEETTIAASPSETTAEGESHRRHESPVKQRIQQFEHLSRDSLNVNKTGIPFVSKNGKKGGGKRNTGAAIWRKISSSLAFNRSVQSWEDGNSEHEPINPTAETSSSSSASLNQASPSGDGARRRSRRSSSFGYSMHRVSHKSRQFVPSHTAPNIHLSVGDLSNSHAKRTTNAQNDHSAPNTPRLVSNSFPILARVSSGLRQPNGFGLDGHSPSKPRPEGGIRSSEATASHPSTPHDDPNALLRVMLEQSAAERNRRRRDEKQLRRDKKLRALTKWNERRKAHVNPHPVDGTAPNVKGKGKGKEKETVEDAPQRDEGPSSKAGENETNKKTESGFAVFESKDVKLRHPKPRRPGQIRKVANLYRDKDSSGVSVSTKASSGVTLKESRQSFRRKASSALGFRSRKGGDVAA
ncbi:hypothetical protein F5B17DRAFT_439098 [Nemania serpens]|nr:hypothetical protein F5B17DRAFT_439098 [Nemania serpens]